MRFKRRCASVCESVALSINCLGRPLPVVWGVHSLWYSVPFFAHFFLVRLRPGVVVTLITDLLIPFEIFWCFFLLPFSDVFLEIHFVEQEFFTVVLALRVDETVGIGASAWLESSCRIY